MECADDFSSLAAMRSPLNLHPLVLAGDWNAFNESDSTLPWRLTRVTAPAVPGTGTPDAFNWFTNTVHVATTGGDTTPGVHSFAFVGGTSYSNQWGGVTINIDGTTSVPFFSGNALGPTNSISLEDGFYYSFRILESESTDRRQHERGGDENLCAAHLGEREWANSTDADR